MFGYKKKQKRIDELRDQVRDQIQHNADNGWPFADNYSISNDNDGKDNRITVAVTVGKDGVITSELVTERVILLRVAAKDGE